MKRILGIDFGTVRMGIALSDTTATIASSRSCIAVNRTKDIFKAINDIVIENECKSIVLGLPISLNGQDTQKTKEVRLFAKELEKQVKLPVMLWDERLSSYEASNIMEIMNVKRAKRKQKKDALAAQIILQSYLNSKKSKSVL